MTLKRPYDRTTVGSLESARDEAYLNNLRDVQYKPVFIIGDHRSGTTILYKLLGLTECFNIITTYHVICYDELLANHAQGTEDDARERLNARFRSLGIGTRLIDDIEVEADLPEEYGMVLHAHSRKLHLTEKNMAVLDELCKKVQYTSDPSRMLLLKNPWDCKNFMTIKELIPESKLIFIHRDPIHTLNSQLKAMRKNWTEGNPYAHLLSKTFARLQENCLVVGYMQWMTNPHSRVQLARRILTFRTWKSMRYFFDKIDLLPRSDYISLRYEKLCNNPAKEIASVLGFLGVKSRLEVDYKRWIKPRPVKLLPGLERVEGKLRKKFRKALL